VIVMLTAESEGGQLKCHPYWSGRDFGPLRLKALSEKKVSLEPTTHRKTPLSKVAEQGRRATTCAFSEVQAPKPAPMATEPPHVIIRKFSLNHAAHPFVPMREITQLHYSSWPDFGAPAQPSHLLALVEQCNAIQRASASSPDKAIKSDDPEDAEHARPVLVHCSAGCGRTGTFCTVDSVIDMLKRQRNEQHSGVTPMEGMFNSSNGGDYLAHSKEPSDNWIFNEDCDLIEKVVEDFRGQRISMVQSLRQYVLCYETVLEWIAQQKTAVRERSGSECLNGEHRR
jgi:protein tyrosine phosphatase